MEIRKQVELFLKEKELLCMQNKFLVACSGGKDSVALVYLLAQLGLSFDIVHVNYNLRGAESIRDRDFVLSLGEELGIKVVVKEVNPEADIYRLKGSVQEVARQIRYSWFFSLLESGRYKALFTAHHQADALETFFINLIRKTGIKGLIPFRSGERNLYRPLMQVTRKQIDDFVINEGIKWVDDSSNSGSAYLRNRIRQQVIPELFAVDKRAEENIGESLQLLSEDLWLYQFGLNKLEEQFVEKNYFGLTLQLDRLEQSFPQPEIPLYYLLSVYDFNRSQISDIWSTYKKRLSGGHFPTTGKNYAVISRNLLQVITNPELLSINERTIFSLVEFLDFLENIKVPATVPLQEVVFCQEKLTFPLWVKPLEPGMFMFAAGGNGKKKMSDLLNEFKIDYVAKTTTWVLTNSEGEVLWWPGYKISAKIAAGNTCYNPLKFPFC